MDKIKKQNNDTTNFSTMFIKHLTKPDTPLKEEDWGWGVPYNDEKEKRQLIVQQTIDAIAYEFKLTQNSLRIIKKHAQNENLHIISMLLLAKEEGVYLHDRDLISIIYKYSDDNNWSKQTPPLLWYLTRPEKYINKPILEALIDNTDYNAKDNTGMSALMLFIDNYKTLHATTTPTMVDQIIKISNPNYIRENTTYQNIKNVEQKTNALGLALISTEIFPDSFLTKLINATTDNLDQSFNIYLQHFPKGQYDINDKMFNTLSQYITEKNLAQALTHLPKLNSQRKEILIENIYNISSQDPNIYPQILVQLLHRKPFVQKDNTYQKILDFILSRTHFNDNNSGTTNPVILAIKNNHNTDTIFKIIDKLPNSLKITKNTINDYIKLPNFEVNDIFYKIIDRYNVNDKDLSGNNTLNNIFLKDIKIESNHLLKIIERTQKDTTNNNNETALNIVLRNNICLNSQQWNGLIQKNNPNIKPKKGLSCKQLLTQTTSNISEFNKKRINNYYTHKFLYFIKSLNYNQKSEPDTQLSQEIDWYALLSLKIEGKSTTEIHSTIEQIFLTMKTIKNNYHSITIEDKIKIDNEFPQILDKLYSKSSVVSPENKQEFFIVLNMLKQNVDKIYQHYINTENKDLKSMRKYLQTF